MAEIWIPRRLQRLTHGEKQVRVEGSTIRQVIDELEVRFPGIKASLYDPDTDALAPGLAVMVDGESTQLGLLERVEEASEVHFLPAIAGGQRDSSAGGPYRKRITPEPAIGRRPPAC